MKSLFAAVASIGLFAASPSFADDPSPFTLDAFKGDNHSDQVDQDYVEKLVFFVIDVSDSMKPEHRQRNKDAILASFEDKNVKRYLDAGNYYQFVFVGYASLGRIEEHYTVNSIESAQIAVNSFFDGDDGQTPRQFSNYGDSTHLTTGLSKVKKFMKERQGFYGEVDVVIFTDGDFSDAAWIEDEKNELLALSDQLQIHCALQTFSPSHFRNTAEVVTTPKRPGPFNTIIPAGSCSRSLDPIEVIDFGDYQPGAEFLPTVTAALSFTMG